MSKPNAVGYRHSCIDRSTQMNQSSFFRGTRFALVAVAVAMRSAPLLAAAGPDAGTEVTAPQMIDAFEGTFGVHPVSAGTTSKARAQQVNSLARRPPPPSAVLHSSPVK